MKRKHNNSETDQPAQINRAVAEWFMRWTLTPVM